MEPPYNEGPRDWQNVFAITRFCYKLSKFFSTYLTTGVKEIVRYTEDFVKQRFVISRLHCTIILFTCLIKQIGKQYTSLCYMYNNMISFL